MFAESDGISASDIYGLEHLVRMLAALPSMMGPVRTSLSSSLLRSVVMLVVLLVVEALVF